MIQFAVAGFIPRALQEILLLSLKVLLGAVRDLYLLFLPQAVAGFGV
jgi:hypothetical protein